MISIRHNHTFFCHLIWLYQRRMMVVAVKPLLPDFCVGKRHYITAKNDLLFWQLHLSPELQLWSGFKRWCKISPLWQPSMGNATHVENSNNWNLPLQRSSPLYKLISHFNHTVVTPLVSETDCVRHLSGSWLILPHWQSWEHSQGHYNCIVMGNFHALDGNKWLPYRCLVVRVCRIMVVSLVR